MLYLHGAYKYRATHSLSIGTLASCLSHMNKYITIEGDNAKFLFQVLLKAPLQNNAMVWLLRLFHIMPCDHFLSGNLNTKVLATSHCDLEDLSERTCI